MIVTRWQAPHVPSQQQIEELFTAEGLSPIKEILEKNTEIPNHRHPFDEVRMIVSGKLLMDIAGNKLLLYPGDRILIPSNTKHSKKVEGLDDCICIYANKVS